MGIETDYGSSPITTILNYIALALFTFECVVKIIAEAILPGTSIIQAASRYLKDHWNKFDSFIVAAGLLGLLLNVNGGGLMIVLRLLRIMRLFRLAKNFPRLRSIIEAFGDGLSSALWVCALIFILNYLASCTGVILFASNDPFHFGRLDSAFFTIWRIETLDQWDVVSKINAYGCATFPSGKGYPFTTSMYHCDPESETAWGWVALIYFLIVVIFGGLLLPTVIVGIVAISFERAWGRYSEEMTMAAILSLLIRQIEEQMPEWWSVDRLRLIKTTFSQLDTEGAGSLDVQDIEDFLLYLVRVYVAAVPYDLDLTPKEEDLVKGYLKELMMAFDASGNAQVNVVEFISFCITTKQVQIKLRLEGVIDVDALLDAVRPGKRLKAFTTQSSEHSERDHQASGLLRENAKVDFANSTNFNCKEVRSPHPMLAVLTGADYREDSGMVEDLSVCIIDAAERCGVDAIDFER